MITVSHTDLETPIVLEYGYPFVLSVENPKLYYKYAVELSKAIAKEISDFSFWEDDERFAIDKYGEIILNPFCFDATDKKVINLLYKKLLHNYTENDLFIQFNEIVAKVDALLYELYSTVDFELEHNELTLENVFKDCGVKPAKNFDNLLEKLVCYINIISELKQASVFILVGVKDVLSIEELIALYKHCELTKINLLLLESGTKKTKIERERKIIITDDLCEIVENIEESY